MNPIPNIVKLLIILLWWTWGESDPRLRNANAAFYH